MEFSITEIMSAEASMEWVEKHFHPQGLCCPHCQAPKSQAREFRRNRRSQVMVYRCRQCQHIYTLYTGTVFEGRHLSAAQVILLLRGILKGETTKTLAQELGLSRTTVTELRQLLQANARYLQSSSPLSDNVVEVDEMFQNAGEKK